MNEPHKLFAPLEWTNKLFQLFKLLLKINLTILALRNFYPPDTSQCLITRDPRGPRLVPVSKSGGIYIYIYTSVGFDTRAFVLPVRTPIVHFTRALRARHPPFDFFHSLNTPFTAISTVDVVSSILGNIRASDSRNAKYKADQRECPFILESDTSSRGVFSRLALNGFSFPNWTPGNPCRGHLHLTHSPRGFGCT